MENTNKKSSFVKRILVLVSLSFVGLSALGTYAYFDPEFDGLDDSSNQKVDNGGVKVETLRETAEKSEKSLNNLQNEIDEATNSTDLTNIVNDTFVEIENDVKKSIPDSSSFYKKIFETMEKIERSLRSPLLNFFGLKPIKALINALSVLVENAFTETIKSEEDKEEARKETPTETSSVSKPKQVTPASKEAPRQFGIIDEIKQYVTQFYPAHQLSDKQKELINDKLTPLDELIESYVTKLEPSLHEELVQTLKKVRENVEASFMGSFRIYFTKLVNQLEEAYKTIHNTHTQKELDEIKKEQERVEAEKKAQEAKTENENLVRASARAYIKQFDPTFPENLIPQVLTFVIEMFYNPKIPNDTMSLLRAAKVQMLYVYYVSDEVKEIVRTKLLLGGRHPDEVAPTPAPNTDRVIESSLFWKRYETFTESVLETLPSKTLTELKEIADQLGIDNNKSKTDLISDISLNISLIQKSSTRLPLIEKQVESNPAINETTNIRSTALTIILEDALDTVKSHTALVYNYDGETAKAHPKQQSLLDDFRSDWLEPTGKIYTEIYNKILTYKTINDVIEIKNLIYAALLRTVKANSLVGGYQIYRNTINNMDHWLRDVNKAILTLQGVKNVSSDENYDLVRKPIAKLWRDVNSFVLKLDYQKVLDKIFVNLKEEVKTLTGINKTSVENFISKYETQFNLPVVEDFTSESLHKAVPAVDASKDTTIYRELANILKITDNPGAIRTFIDDLDKLEDVQKLYSGKVHYDTSNDKHNYLSISKIEENVVYDVAQMYVFLKTTPSKLAISNPEQKEKLDKVLSKTLELVTSWTGTRTTEWNTKKDELLKYYETEKESVGNLRNINYIFGRYFLQLFL